MSKHLTFVVFVAAALIQSVAAAAFGWYNPVNGNIHISNGTGAPLAHVSIISVSGKLTNASLMASIQGATKDDSEFPFAYTYLNFPVGTHDTGNTVQPGTPVTALSIEYRTASLFGPLLKGYFVEPEPSSCLLALTSAVAFSGTIRRSAPRQ
ncbi:MAG: hypothetical protein C0485_11430 [Pirellula sp.]|nr:hypothetical protein [Pirellula sp.]